jgi:hypothetical protein
LTQDITSFELVPSCVNISHNPLCYSKIHLLTFKSSPSPAKSRVESFGEEQKLTWATEANSHISAKIIQVATKCINSRSPALIYRYKLDYQTHWLKPHIRTVTCILNVRATSTSYYKFPWFTSESLVSAPTTSILKVIINLFFRPASLLMIYHWYV